MKNPDKMSDRELRKELCQTRRLLVLAKCPDENCDGKGTVCFGEYLHDNGEVEYDLQQCQWCAERSMLVE